MSMLECKIHILGVSSLQIQLGCAGTSVKFRWMSTILCHVN